MQHNRRQWLAGAGALLAAAAIGASSPVMAQGQPIKVGIGIAQTGPLGGGGKAALLALQMWVDDVNAKGGLLGRKVRADRLRRSVQPRDHARHLHQAARRRQGRPADRALRHQPDRADHADGEAARPAADGQLLVRGERERSSTTCGSTTRRGTDAVELVRHGFLEAGQDARRARPSPSSPPTQEFAQNLANGARAIAKAMGLKTVYDQNYPPNTVDFSSMIRAIRAAKPDIVFVASYPTDSVAHRARGERDRRRRLGQAVRRRHGRPAVHADHGIARLAC